MRKRKKLVTVLLAGLLGSCCIAGGMCPKKVEAAYEWSEVKCISVAQPYSYSEYNNVSFQVFFDKDVTDVNYKHLAAPASVLKTMSKYDNPNMTNAIADSLERDGIIDSLNDCITFNGKKVREYQKTSPLACMIMVGELGVTNSINIDFNGMIADAKIDDLNQPFEITLHEGLRFPSGVELKETVTWTFDPNVGEFTQKLSATDKEDAGFDVYYNGQKITKENNVVKIYDKDAFSFRNLSVYPNSSESTYTIEPQFETIAEGQNYVLIKCTAANQYEFEDMQIVFEVEEMPEIPGTIFESIPAVVTIAVIAVLVMVGVIVIIRTTKRGKAS